MAHHDANPGFETRDLLTSPGFLEPSTHLRTPAIQLLVLQRLAHLLTESPETVLQELVESLCELSDAGSAGISMETLDTDGTPVSHWVALTGVYAPFLNAMVPQAAMPCKICLETQRPQLIRIPSEHFKACMNVDVPPVTEGMLIPWSSDGQRATIWVVSHTTYNTFARGDYDLLQVFAGFAAVAYRNLRQNSRAVAHASMSGADAMAQSLAQLIKDPLQSLVNHLHRAREGGPNAAAHTQQATNEADQLEAIVKDILSIYSIHSIQ